MWSRVWRRAGIQWHGFRRTREEFDLFIVKTSRPTLPRGTRFCSAKVWRIGKTSLRLRKAPVESSTTSWNRKAVDFLNSKPPADVSRPSGRSMRADQFLKQALQVKRDRFLDLGNNRPVSH